MLAGNCPMRTSSIPMLGVGLFAGLMLGTAKPQQQDGVLPVAVVSLPQRPWVELNYWRSYDELGGSALPGWKVFRVAAGDVHRIREGEPLSWMGVVWSTCWLDCGADGGFEKFRVEGTYAEVTTKLATLRPNEFGDVVSLR